MRYLRFSPGRGPTVAVRPRRASQSLFVPLSRIAWLLTVLACLGAAALLILNGYVGYFGVLLAVGAAAAVNLLR